VSKIFLSQKLKTDRVADQVAFCGSEFLTDGAEREAGLEVCQTTVDLLLFNLKMT